MKKSFFVLSLAVVFLFATAIGLCARALTGAQAVAAFDEGGMRVVVDAGHGGMDGGVVGRKTGVKESDVNLAVSFRLRDVLTDMGFDVILTRKTEAGLYDTATRGFKKRDMQKRKEIIETSDPALVISVHQNFYPAKSSRGAQVFYSTTHEGSKLLALAMQGQLNTLYETQGAKPRVEKEGDFFILECIARPSVIVECGFLSNPSDEELLCSESWQQKLAESIAAGVEEYLAGNAA